MIKQIKITSKIFIFICCQLLVSSLAFAQAQELDDISRRIQDLQNEIRLHQREIESALQQATITQSQDLRLQPAGENRTELQRDNDTFRDIQFQNRKVHEQEQQTLRDSVRNLRKYKQ